MAALLISPVIGSFLGVLVRRLPAGRDVAWARSSCEACGHPLAVRDLVPLLGFLLQRGRCRYCGAAIEAFHLWIELAALGVAGWSAWVDTGARLWADCLLGWGLLALALIDADHMILPDVLTLPLVLCGLSWWAYEDPSALAGHALGAMLGYLLFRLVAGAYRRVRGREGLGQGDAKLLAAGGAWVGWQNIGLVVLVAGVSGLVVALVQGVRRGSLPATMAVPFGPALALGIWIVWLYAA